MHQTYRHVYKKITYARGNTHAYIQTQLDRSQISELVAERALDAWVKCLVTKAPFDGREYGQEYLSFASGENILPVEHPENGDDWSLGCLLASQQTGWYPTAFA